MSSFSAKILLIAAALAVTGVGAPARAASDLSPGVRKVRDLVIYEDAKFHAAFPSVVRRPDGELLVAFRRAPDRQVLGEKKTYHVDPNSYLVMVRSSDGAATWTKEPALIYAHAFGGSQDPGLPKSGRYQVLIAYPWNANRASNVPVTIRHADGETKVALNEKKKPAVKDLLEPVGTFRFEKGRKAQVEISNADTNGYVVIDAVQWIEVAP